MDKKEKINPSANLEDVKTLREIFEVVLGARVPSSRLTPYIKTTFGDKLTNAELIAIGQLLKAQNERDTKAAEFIRDTMGQKPGNEHKLIGSKDQPFVIALQDDLDEWAG